MKKLLYTLAAVLVCTGAAAQNPTLYFMEGVPLRSQMNPALAPQRGYFNIPVLGGLAVTAGGNTSLDHLLFRRDGRLVTLLSPSVSSADALSDLHSKNLVNADIWRRVCELEGVDLIYNCTDWQMHVPIALYAMERGKHVAVEVPAALTVADCWALVDAAERTRRHCMMLENCCYDFFEMTTLNMAREGLFGEIVHVEGAYIHDLRELQFDRRHGYVDMWRLEHNALHTGNPYPTHGLGPLCQLLDIHRGDRMERLVSLSSDQFGMSAYATAKYGAESAEAERPYALGDMNTTLIRTARGKSILIQHDITSPRPYNRLHTISGTKGFAQKYPIRSLAFDPDAHHRLSDEQLDQMLRRYEHPITREIGEKAREVGGHGGMDFIMDYRLVYCLRHGLPLDQDVYDAAEWSSLAELTEASVRNGSMPVAMPDFTRGAWRKVEGFSHAMAE